MNDIINTANRADWVLQETGFYGNILICWKEHLLQQHIDLEEKKIKAKENKSFVEANICNTEGNSYLECSWLEILLVETSRLKVLLKRLSCFLPFLIQPGVLMQWSCIFSNQALSWEQTLTPPLSAAHRGFGWEQHWLCAPGTSECRIIRVILWLGGLKSAQEVTW